MTVLAALERLGSEIDAGNMTPQELAAILERERILRAMCRFGWNQCAAADSMGIHRNTLMRRMATLGIEKPADAPRVYAPKQGPPFSEIGKLAKVLGVRTDQVANNGLNRNISPLVMRLRLREIERTERRRANRKQQATERIEQTLVAAERLTALERFVR